MTKLLCVDSGQMAFIPVLDADDGQLHAVLDVEPGKFKVFIESSDEGSWGVRISSLAIMRADHARRKNVKQILIGTLDVKTNKIIVSDPCYIHNDEMGSGDSYDRACNATLSNLGAGIYKLTNGDMAAVSSTGYGDGDYPLDVEYDANGKAIYAVINFIDDCSDYSDDDYVDYDDCDYDDCDYDYKDDY